MPIMRGLTSGQLVKSYVKSCSIVDLILMEILDDDNNNDNDNDHEC